MSETLVFLHGRFVSQAEAVLTLHDAGFVMGATVTDLCRTFHQKLYRWPEHLRRFRASCRSTSINPPLGEDDISARAEELVSHNADLLPPDQELGLVLFATPGPIGYYLGEPGGVGAGPVTFGMHTFPLLLHRYRPWVERGAALVVPSVRQIPVTCMDPHIKMRSRMHWWLADREARLFEPGATPLLLDTEGAITETAGANVLLVLDGKVVSPPRTRILEGISLSVVMELCGKLGIPFVEQPLALADLALAEEVLLASTPYCLVGVSRCQGTAVPWPGDVYRRLVQAWSDSVGLDVHGQILGERRGLPPP